MELINILKQSELLVKQLTEGMTVAGLGLAQVEQEVIGGLQEPTQENSVVVGDRVAVYAGKRNLRYRNRFG